MNEVSKLMAHLTAKHKKEELSSEKLELNLVKSVESNSKKADALLEQGIKKIFSAIGELKSAVQTLEKSKDAAQKALSEGKELEKMADNIGAELTPTTKAAIQRAFDIGELEASQIIKDTKKAISALQ